MYSYAKHWAPFVISVIAILTIYNIKYIVVNITGNSSI